MRKMIVRKKMQKAYNSGQFELAVRIANDNLECPLNGELAKSIIIRDFWNQRDFEKVIEFCNKWPEANMQDLRKRAENNLQRTRRYKTSTAKIQTKIAQVEAKTSPSSEYQKRDPTPDGEDYANADYITSNVKLNWYQTANRVWFRHPNGWVYWDMPEGYLIKDTHDSLIELATDVLLRPWSPEVKMPLTKGRKFGDKLALSYSGGMDSTAAAFLLPEDTIMAYNERSFTSMIDHRNALRLFEAWKEILGRDVLKIPSNHEIIRATHGKQVGFSTDYASGVHLILLADFLDLGGIAFGVPIDNTWLQKGKKFREFDNSSHWKLWSNRFKEAGLELVLAINHISEAGALRICEKSPLIDSINSCMRGDGKEGCGKCWKCFHKNGPLGRKMDPLSFEINKFLTDRPLRTAQHALWAIQIQKLEDLVPDLSHHLENDLSWWEKAYSPGLEIIPEKWRNGILDTTSDYLEWMDDFSKLENTDLFPN